jgi:hypothetical protein
MCSLIEMKSHQLLFVALSQDDRIYPIIHYLYLGYQVELLAVHGRIAWFECERDEVEPEITRSEVGDVKADVGVCSIANLDARSSPGGSRIECRPLALRSGLTYSVL